MFSKRKRSTCVSTSYRDVRTPFKDIDQYVISCSLSSYYQSSFRSLKSLSESVVKDIFTNDIDSGLNSLSTVNEDGHDINMNTGSGDSSNISFQNNFKAFVLSNHPESPVSVIPDDPTEFTERTEQTPSVFSELFEYKSCPDDCLCLEDMVNNGTARINFCDIKYSIQFLTENSSKASEGGCVYIKDSKSCIPIDNLKVSSYKFIVNQIIIVG